MTRRIQNMWRVLPLAAAIAFAVGAGPTSGKRMEGARSADFGGAKVNGGYVQAQHEDGKLLLTLSDDFRTPDTPDPHWQVVDDQGQTYLLNRLMIKGGVVSGDKLNRTITVPAYIPNVAKVQVWCAWAEIVLGEASFPETLSNRM